VNLTLLKRVNRKNRMLAIIAVAGVTAAGTLMATSPRHDPTEVQEKAWPVSAQVIEPQTLSPEVRVFGRVETPHHAQLTSAVSATVQTVNVSEGQTVKKGQVLLNLDDADEQLRYQQRLADTDQAAAELATTESELDSCTEVLAQMRQLLALSQAKVRRLEKLQQNRLVAVEKLEETRALVARQAIETAQQQLKVDNHPQRLAAAQAKLDRARALLEEQDLRLSRTVILAPFDGRISNLSVSPGNRVMEGQQLIALYDTSALQVRVSIPRDDALPIREAMASARPVKAVVTTEAGDVALKLHQLAAEVRRGSAGVEALFRIDSEASSLEVGRAVDVTVTLPAVEQVAAVPVHSVYGEDRIYTIVDGRLQGIQVTSVGQRTNAAGQLELLLSAPALRNATPVLTTTLPRASDGLLVNVVNG
jgi:RND family efflux transporter MFP subunit